MQTTTLHGLDESKTLLFLTFSKQIAFARADLKIAKKTYNMTIFFVLSGSVHVKAASRTLIKLTPGVNFINILHAPFSYKSTFQRIRLITIWL